MYKEIILILESRTDSASRLQFACELAATQAARLVVLSVPELDLSGYEILPNSYVNLVALRQAQEIDRAKTATAETMFRELMAAASVEGEWRETEDLSAAHVAHIARHGDLLLFGAHDGPGGARSIKLDVPAVILESGCPAIILPELPHPQLPFRRILVAWKASKEARRAVHDALPLLREAEQVIILAIREEAAADGGDSAYDVAEHLRRHGVEALVERSDLAGRDSGAAILAHAAKMDANLIVAGFYGHARVTEFVLGGVSRKLLENPRIPLFLSH